MIDRLDTLNFGQPWWLLLLLLLPLYAWLQGQRGGQAAAMRYSAVGVLRNVGHGVKRARGGWPLTLTFASLALMAIAMARPRVAQGDSPDKREGVDIVFCCDVSGSMDTPDFNNKGEKISRREALVMAINDFVDRRPNDRFGMIGFAGHTYLMSPMTLDGEWIKGVLKTIRTQHGTAIGEGIVASIDLLKSAKTSTKVMIVVTDGQNNAGVDPLKAADAAKAAGIRVHTIEVTSLGHVSGNKAVKSLLSKVAERTGGQYFQAASLDSMVEVYRQIDKMEKTEFEQRKYRVYDELFFPITAIAFGLFAIGFIGGHTIWMRVP